MCTVAILAQALVGPIGACAFSSCLPARRGGCHGLAHCRMALVGLVCLLLSGVPHGHASRRVPTERGPCAGHVWMGGATVLRSRASSPTRVLGVAGRGRPCRSVAARGACSPPDVRRGGASSGRSLARSYACGYRSPAELEPRGRARSRRACGSIRPKCHRVVVRFVAANPPLHTHPRCAGQAGADDASPRSSERYARARRHGSGRGACAEVNMLR